ncbi:MAG: FAD-dependent oxidoreductase [Gemmatimonadetes bacterium]|nr:FAD-dependent oxidoreductase [Gemmatimonadota bacterium]NNM07214.1 FAD-dependent oxidoreductase [Gemmatimonadota bacterium]
MTPRSPAVDWPYPVEWDQTSTIETDVLVLGGGVAGCWAAIGAARKGVRVVLVEKGATVGSGAGGSGCDHWESAATNPCSRISPEDLAEAMVKSHGGYGNGISHYIACREGWDRLVDLEAMGGKIRDTEGEFVGAEFRDETTKLLFAHDYEKRYTLRVWGTTFESALYGTCRLLGVRVLDRTMATSLLRGIGGQGSKIVGATGVHTRTGRFVILEAKATVLCMSRPSHFWLSSPEMPSVSEFRPPQCCGDGHAMAWKAGAEFTMMEKSARAEWSGTRCSPPHGTGNTHNTSDACSMLGAEGRELFGYPGGLMNDWALRTNLDGLYAAGDQLFASKRQGHAAATGHYAGRHAAAHAVSAPPLGPRPDQAKVEQDRIHTLVNGLGGVEWPEVNATIACIMQEHCGQKKSAATLAPGLLKLKDIRRNEALHLRPRNPPELIRVLEVLNLLTDAELVIHSCLAREASARYLLFERLDFPDLDPPAWNKFVTVRLVGSEVVEDGKALDYYGPLKEGYEALNADYLSGTNS